MAAFAVAVPLCVCAAGQPPQPTAREYAKDAVSPGAMVRAAAGAGITQATDTPSEWGQGAAGFGRRLASAFGKHLVKKAIQYPVARLRHEALGYQRSDQTDFKLRLRHALLATVYTTKTTTGKRTVAAGEISGAFGSGLISRLWQPASVRAVGFGFLSGGITLGVDAGTNVLREFWPDIRHRLHHGRAQAEFPQPEPAAAPPGT
jgi:hypothetical protein